MLLSIVTTLGIRLALVEVKEACLQSGPIQRDVYVQPPAEFTIIIGYTREVL